MANDILWRFAIEFAMATGFMNQISGIFNIGIEIRPCSNCISIKRA